MYYIEVWDTDIKVWRIYNEYESRIVRDMEHQDLLRRTTVTINDRVVQLAQIMIYDDDDTSIKA